MSQDASLKFDTNTSMNLKNGGMGGMNNKTSTRASYKNNDKRLLNSPLSNNRYGGKGGHISGYDRQSVQLTAKVEKQHK